MEFCPNCGNLLMVEKHNCMRFNCPTCSYVFPITKKVSVKLPLTRKQVDHVLGDEVWKSAQKTDLVTCEKCCGVGAYFMQLQIRSADEPMTTFYRCCNNSCGYQWRD
eukprot:TRINITY_DN18080_c0_g1_i1.p3 TRINITY_DN18080_c0_g1~~TRINITY_DN18080_c0_g1_i1.p3  ORF type:complete len:118 (-),score=33.94 TRINITY_DN18080_c0_g1_i1:64-384(-)